MAVTWVVLSVINTVCVGITVTAEKVAKAHYNTAKYCVHTTAQHVCDHLCSQRCLKLAHLNIGDLKHIPLVYELLPFGAVARH